LSFLFTDSAPDDALWTDAQNGSLTSPAVLASHVTRLSFSLPAQYTLPQYASYWLAIERVPFRTKNPALFPEYSSAVSAALQKSGEAFVKDVVLNGKLADLFSSSKVYVNRDLGLVFGIAGASGTSLVPVVSTLPERNAGILTQPAFLAATNQRAALADPVHRGLFVLERLLCGGEVGQVPGPPPGSETVAATMHGTEREIAEQRAMTAPCTGCHRYIDPYGVTMLGYDAIGRYSPNRYVVADTSVDPPVYRWVTIPTNVDTSAIVPDTVGVDLAGPLADVSALARQLASHGPDRRVAYCAGMWLSRYALGHDASLGNSCKLQSVKENFYRTGSFPQFYSDLVTSPAFALRHRY
jgi:hypothetical protein